MFFDLLSFAFSSGVIDLLGGAGGLVEFKASLLASRGFAALALAYLAYDDLPVSPPVLDMEYFEEAANWLSNHPKVLPHGIAVHSICYGTWIALLMASLKMKAVKAVVAISPITTAFLFPFKYKGKVSETISLDHSKKINIAEGTIARFGHSTVINNNTPISKYPPITPVENIACPVLTVFGTDDLNAIPDFSVKHICKALKKHGQENLCTVLCYPNAGHLIEPPYTPHCYSSYLKNVGKLTGEYHIVWGGEMNCHARAQEDAWPKILSFLQKNIVNIKGKL